MKVNFSFKIRTKLHLSYSSGLVMMCLQVLSALSASFRFARRASFGLGELDRRHFLRARWLRMFRKKQSEIKSLGNANSQLCTLSEMKTLRNTCPHLIFLSTFFIFAVQSWNAKGKGSPRGVLFLICSIPGLARSDEMQ